MPEVAPGPKLTMRQQWILNAIHEHIARRGYPPSIREICNAVGLSSTSSVYSHLRTIEARGYIRVDDRIPRGICVLNPEATSA